MVAARGPEHGSSALRVPPPLLFAATFLAGFGLERLWPLGPALGAHGAVWAGAGAALAGCGVLLGAAAIAAFARARTTVIPHGNPARLVTAGPYRFSRNPMYLGLALTYLGIAGIMRLPWAAMLLPLPLLWLDRLVIPLEEARLRAAFGGSYDAYRRRVRRWL